MKLSAVVVTQNEERNIQRCLGSVQFADEIVLVDAFSEDRTAELAERLGARVILREWDGFASQHQFAVDQARGEWILLLGADEVVSNELAEELQRILGMKQGPGGPDGSNANDGERRGPDAASVVAAGFKIRRSNYFLGEKVHHGPWANDYQIRLFRKARGAIAQRPVHEGVQVDGDLATLQGPLTHYTHQTLTESFRRLNRYTTLEATERASRRRIGLVDIVISPIGAFLRYYVRGGCWRAGVNGFLLSATMAMYRSVLYLKTYLLQRQNHVDSIS